MLIIVESPAKAKTISKILGKSHIVKASVGHIRQISEDKKTKDGRKLEINGIDIDSGFLPIFEVDPGKKDVVKELKTLTKKAGKILFATDEDREGEAISWHLAKVLNLDEKKIERLVFHEITKTAIEKALKNTRKLDLNLVTAQQARQVLDKLVGYKLSPVLWQVLKNRRLSAGRVQSPALKLVVDRENEIENFIPENYQEIFGWFVSEYSSSTVGKENPQNFSNSDLLEGVNKNPSVAANFNSPSSSSSNGKQELSSTDKITVSKPVLKQTINETETEKLKQIDFTKAFRLTLLQGEKIPAKIKQTKGLKQKLDKLLEIKNFTVKDSQIKPEKAYPKPPFTTSTLQQAASSFLGFAPRRTMRLAQRLYEGVQVDGSPTALITYMRTDSLNLSTESLTKARQFLKKTFPQFLPPKAKTYTTKSKSAQEAHEAIRPTDPLRTPASLRGKIEPDQLKLYELIWKRMVSSQMTEQVKERLTVILENNQQDEFTGGISRTVKDGFRAVWNYGNKPDDVETWKYFESVKAEGQVLHRLVIKQSQTKPPARYSPASLIKKLEELGIGRPSTYASIISTLHDRKYVDDNPKVLIPTVLGRQVSLVLVDNFAQVTSSDLTADLENNLDKLATGESQYTEVLKHFWTELLKQVEISGQVLTENQAKYVSVKTNVKDPKTGEEMEIRFGPYGEYYQNLKNPEAKYPIDYFEKKAKLEKVKNEIGEDLEKITCPTCGHKMELKAGRFGEYFQCLNVKEHRFPKNFREYNAALKEAQEKFADQAKGKKCEECSKDLIVRVSKSSLKPYIACPDYKVGNKHTVTNVTYGPCPKCQKEGRNGQLISRRSKKGLLLICNLPKKECGYVQSHTNL